MESDSNQTPVHTDFAAVSCIKDSAASASFRLPCSAKMSAWWLAVRSACFLFCVCIFIFIWFFIVACAAMHFQKSVLQASSTSRKKKCSKFQVPSITSKQTKLITKKCSKLQAPWTFTVSSHSRDNFGAKSAGAATHFQEPVPQDVLHF